jgi:putative transcriptional regulator
MLRNRLREIRHRAGLTQHNLAQQVGVTRQTIIAIERGGYTPSVLLALRLCQVLDVALEEMFLLENNTEGG